MITKRLFGEGELALALGTVAISFALLVFSEITPKVVGATHADRIAPIVSYILAPMLKAATPIVWFVNLFVQGLLKLLRIPSRRASPATTLTQEELRSLVLEGQYFRGKHRAMLANLLDLEAVTVDDVMTPRNQIHALDLTAKPAHLAQQLATSYHTRLPAYEDELDNIVGVIHLKQVVGLQQRGDDRRGRAALDPAPGVFRARGHAAPCASCSSSRTTASGWASSSTSTASSRASSRSRTSSRRSSATSRRRRRPAANHGRGDRRQRRRRRPGAAAHAQPQARHAISRSTGPKTLNGLIVEQLGEIPDAGTRVDGRRPDARNPADAGPWRKSRTPAAARGAATAPPLQSQDGQASSAGLSFMRLE